MAKQPQIRQMSHTTLLSCSITYLTESCGGIYDMAFGDSVTISSPDFPLYYPANVECTWRFNTQQRGSFAIHFHHFHTENHHDELAFGQGAAISNDFVLYRVSSFVPSHVVVVIEQVVMWAVFSSNVGVARSGFSLEIERIEERGRCAESSINCQ